MSPEGGGKKKFYLLGSDYVYPRTTNKILRLYLTKVKKVPESAIAEEYTPFHHQDYQTIVGKIKTFSAAGDAAVINTINGDSNVPFFKELANQGVTADKTPTMSFSFAEVELQTLDVKPLVGHLASWNYFMSLKTPENLKWVKAYKEWCKGHGIPDKQCVTDDPMMHAYIHVHLWRRRSRRRSPPTSRRCSERSRVSRSRARWASTRWTRRTTTRGSRSTSARSARTVSSTSSGRPNRGCDPRRGAR